SGITIDRHLQALLDSPPLGRAAAVMRDGGDVLDGRDLEAGGLQRPDGGLAAGAGALDPHLDALHAGVQRFARARLGGHLGREGRALARTLEPYLAGARPGDDVAVRVADRDDRVVEAGLNVSDPVGAHLSVPLLCLLDLSHSRPP